ncbi:MAG: hypothetical protein AAF694_01000 [Bacteroidota bacterium]
MLPADYKDHVRRIISSKDFGHSRSYAALLEYIVQKSVEGNIPKEATIAIDVFGKDGTFNPSEDTLVRVYVHNLRKKLQVYYRGDGQGESYQIMILKGRYQALFLSKSELEEKSSEPVSLKTNLWLWGTVIALGLCLGISLIGNVLLYNFRFLNAYKTPKETLQKSKIWQQMLEVEQPISFILGDIFVFTEYDSLLDRGRLIRDSQVNTASEFDSLITFTPQWLHRSPKVSENPLLMKAHALSLEHLIPAFTSLELKFSVRLMSRTSSEELQEMPILYLGMYKSMGKLTYLFEDSQFELIPGGIQLMHRPDGKLLSGEGVHDDYHTDLGYLSQRIGPGGNPIWIIAAFTDTGIMQLSQQLASFSNITSFESIIHSQLGERELPKEWEALFSVKGFDRAQLEMELDYVYAID